jgi:MOSC domain-containing protein
MSRIEVSQLLIYPAKSMGHISLDESDVDRFGLHNDRRWMLVDKDGGYVTQRKYPRMCLIRASLIDGQLVLQAPAMPVIRVPAANLDGLIGVRVWDDQCNAYDCGKDIAQWLSEFIGIKCRLVYFPEGENRLVDQDYADPEEYTAFSDGFPILLISQASLNDLNSRLESPVPMTRFRPNLVVTGCEAYAEDGWKRIKAGDLVLRIVKPCSRCVIPTIDTETGKKGKEPLSTLSQYRRQNNKVFFGQNVIANSAGMLETGMLVEILE